MNCVGVGTIPVPNLRLDEIHSLCILDHLGPTSRWKQDAKEDPMEEEVKFAMMKRIAMFFQLKMTES